VDLGTVSTRSGLKGGERRFGGSLGPDSKEATNNNNNNNKNKINQQINALILSIKIEHKLFSGTRFNNPKVTKFVTFEDHKTKTKLITPTNDKRHKENNEPIRT